MKKHLFAAAAILSLSACATIKNPTAADVANADYGPPIARDDAVAQAKETMSVMLKDPESARWTCAPEVHTVWYHEAFTKTTDTFYGWSLDCLINAKNSYGGYTGDRDYNFYYRNDKLVRIYNYRDGVHDYLHMQQVY